MLRGRRAGAAPSRQALEGFVLSAGCGAWSLSAALPVNTACKYSPRFNN